MPATEPPKLRDMAVWELCYMPVCFLGVCMLFVGWWLMTKRYRSFFSELVSTNLVDHLKEDFVLIERKR